MTQNAEDGGSRRFIAVQIPEYIDENHQAFNDGYKTISDVCIERIKRAGRKIKTENPNTSIDTGFRVYRLTDSYFPENLFKSDPDKSEAENLAALKRHLEIASQANLFDEKDLDDIITELSLKNGYGLFFTLTPLHDDFPENKVYRLSGHDRNVLLCLDAELKQGTVETLTANHTEDQVILSKYALDTAKNWTLQNAFRDNLRVV